VDLCNTDGMKTNAAALSYKRHRHPVEIRVTTLSGGKFPLSITEAFRAL